MTTTGLKTAKAPVSPHANLVALERVGTKKWGSAIWSVACRCGAQFSADTTTIKNGITKCETCNPSEKAVHLKAILAAMPGTYDQLERRTKLTYGQVQYSLLLLRADKKCFIGGHARAAEQGSFNPIFHAGMGEDVPCKLQPVPRIKSERKHRRRVKAAVEKALAGGKEDPRYLKHISLRVAKKTAEQTRAKPSTWFSILEATC